MRSAILTITILSLCVALASATCLCVPRSSPYAVPIAQTVKKIVPNLPQIIPNLPQIPKNIPSLPHLQIPSIPKPKLPIGDDTPKIPIATPQNPPQNPYGSPSVTPSVNPEGTATPSAIHNAGSALLTGIAKTLCSKATTPSLCESSIQPFLGSVKGSLDAKAVLRLTMKAVLSHTATANATCTKLIDDPKTDKQTLMALKDCRDGYDDVVYSMEQTETALLKGDIGTVGSMLSAVSTDADTCENGFDEFEIPSPLAEFDSMIMKLNSNCLAIARAAGLMNSV